MYVNQAMMFNLRITYDQAPSYPIYKCIPIVNLCLDGWKTNVATY